LSWRACFNIIKLTGSSSTNSTTCLSLAMTALPRLPPDSSAGASIYPSAVADRLADHLVEHRTELPDLFFQPRQRRLGAGHLSRPPDSLKVQRRFVGGHRLE